MKIVNVFILLLIFTSVFAQEAKRDIKIDKKYLNIPVEAAQDRQVMSFEAEGETLREFDIRVSDGKADYWVFSDMSEFQGKSITINYPEKRAGFKEIYQSDEFAGADSIYKEINRPQFHFTSKKGWNNDPNGLVYYDGEYHLYYQHNPYGIRWGNMHWGHAVSKDLIHWEELGDVLYPDEHGTMFSGSAAVDWNNSSGWQTGEEKTIIVAYTADGTEKEVQCIAYSNDRGRTLTKYEGNPVIDSKEKWNSYDTRDPKLIWHEDLGKWVMILHEKTGLSIYHSDDTKNWTYISHFGEYWDCPELFALPVDGNKYNKKWVTYGGSGAYQIGDFDGYTFTPETDKLNYFDGNMYAAQTFTDIAESDGRRIQVGWGLIWHPGMSFSQMITFPTELTLRSTRNGVRLFSEPIREIENLHTKSHKWSNLSPEEANENLKSVSGDLFHIKMTVQVLQGTDFRFLKGGSSIVHYTYIHNKLNGAFYGGDRLENMTISLELLIDRTSIEIFADNGRFSVIDQLPEPENNKGLEFRGRAIIIPKLEVHELKSIW